MTPFFCRFERCFGLYRDATEGPTWGRRCGGGRAGPKRTAEPEPIYKEGDEFGAEESWLQGDWVFSDDGAGPSHTASDAARPSRTMSCGASQEYEAPRQSPCMSTPVFSGSTHDGGCIFVPTLGMPTPPLVHVEPTMGPSPPTLHEEAVQIEQIPGEDIQPMEGLRISQHPPVHAPDCRTGDGIFFLYIAHRI
nr:hypothetical protein CFP56_55786 [Quercus suber]